MPHPARGTRPSSSPWRRRGCCPGTRSSSCSSPSAASRTPRRARPRPGGGGRGGGSGSAPWPPTGTPPSCFSPGRSPQRPPRSCAASSSSTSPMATGRRVCGTGSPPASGGGGAPHRLARAAGGAFRKEGAPPAPAGWDGFTSALVDSREAAFLDVAAPEEFRVLLREWSAAEGDGERAWATAWALRTLLQLGDSSSVPRLAALVEGWGSHGELETGTSPLLLLDRSPCPEVETFLRGKAAEEPWNGEGLAAYAALLGFPGGALA